MTKTKTREFEVTISKEHLSQAVRDYLYQYGYFNTNEDYYEITGVTPNDNGTVTLNGKVD